MTSNRPQIPFSVTMGMVVLTAALISAQVIKGRPLFKRRRAR